VSRRLLAVLALAACTTARPPEAVPAPGPALTRAEGEAAAPAPLPPPLPPPAAPEEPLLRAEPHDPLELLWSHRLNFAAGGAPLVTIRLVEGQAEIAFRPRGPARLSPRGAAAVPAPAGERLRARVRGALPAVLAHFPLLAQAEFRDRVGLEAARRAWERRGVPTRVRVLGGVYGIAGRVVDNRRQLLLAEGDGSEAWAGTFADGAYARYGERPGLFSELVTRPSGTVEVVDGAGKVIAAGDTVVALDGDAGFALEDRAYRGRLYLTVDAAGGLAAVHGVALEELLRGLVPSEMPASSPPEALKAQAVTARSNVLAQIGTRHLTDPYVLCAEVHCQVYRGEAAEVASSDAAVRATAGEALFGKADRALVDGVYSAMCGGHGEDNEAVWGTVPDPSLRGRPDLPPAEAAAWKGGLADEARLREFLGKAPQGWCGRATAARPDRYRWERRFTSAEVDAIAAPLGAGPVRALEVAGRGVSGRARALRLAGGQGSVTVHGELRIRRLFRNLPSSMFVVDRDGDAWVFRGGGWGHGVGMCQWGAVGRAEARQDYRQILRAYFSGAEVAKIY
jgi:stage II sporulation protein D